MKLTQILLSLAAISFFGATATPASRTDRPFSLPRKAIPAGATIYGLDGNSNKSDDNGPFSEIAKRALTNCDTGSLMCGVFSLPSETACNAASGAYDDNAWYCGYTTRFSDVCIAKFGCNNYNVCWAGWFIKDSFNQISCPQSQCGTTYFDNGNCYTSYDYCFSCHNVG